VEIGIATWLLNLCYLYVDSVLGYPLNEVRNQNAFVKIISVANAYSIVN
jgi:hypothetical protein